MRIFLKQNSRLLLMALSITLLTNCNSDDDSENRTLLDFVDTNTGVLSSEYLSAATFKSLEVEIAYEVGAKPTQIALDSLLSFLNQRLNKPNGISYKMTEVADQEKSRYSIAQIRQAEKDFRTSTSRGDKMSAFFYFANGNYDQDTTNSFTLGVAFNSSSMAIFEKTIRENSGGLGQASRELIEEGVLKHEFGHILGLVNLGSDLQTDHEDQQHPKHCDVPDCLMYYALETNQFIGMMGGSNNVPRLDPQCIADLKANGGK